MLNKTTLCQRLSNVSHSPGVSLKFYLMMYGLDINGTVTSGNKLADASRSQSAESTSSGTSRASAATSGAGTVRSSWADKLFMMIFACLLL